jgi:hypothetical protein
MKTAEIKTFTARASLGLKRQAHGFEVRDRLLGQTFVEVDKGRWVGSCSCGCGPSIPFLSCRHQSAVRDFLFESWFRKIG